MNIEVSKRLIESLDSTQLEQISEIFESIARSLRDRVRVLGDIQVEAEAAKAWNTKMWALDAE